MSLNNPSDSLDAVKGAVKGAIVGTSPDSSDEPPLNAETRKTFEEHAKKDEETGELFMTQTEFLNSITPPESSQTAGYHKIPRSAFLVLFRVADRQQKGKITQHDYAAFTSLLHKSDAEYEIAFRIFDVDGNGSVSFEEFLDIFKKFKKDGQLQFDWNSNWATLYIGGAKARHELTYDQFCQMVTAIQGERVRQAFRIFDKNGTGYITPTQFQQIIKQTSGHKLSDHTLEHLHTLGNLAVGNKISYPIVRAFLNIMKEMDIVNVIVKRAVKRSKDGRISKQDFLDETSRVIKWGPFTPMEASVLFHFAALDNPSGRISLSEFQKVVDPSWKDPSQELDFDKKEDTSFVQQILKSSFNFVLGSIAGSFGATMVYPIDLVKTRMQNQRKAVIGQQHYANSMDCAKQVLKKEGFRGFYSGLVPQLVGVAPEKAIKLTVNDLVRSFGKTMSPDGKITLPWEIAAGAAAGGCQVVFTNPLEIVKIRLQVQGEASRAMADVQKRSAMYFVKNLGVFGLYKGASACLLRDIPFSAIYFPTYAHLKKTFGEDLDKGKKLPIYKLLVAGAIVGMPAAYLTTPCDVIKTRLQVEARKGETQYRGLSDAARTIFREEGIKAFFKGGPARVLRSSPQFGFTLAAYEMLQNVVPMPGSAAEEVAEKAKTEALPYLRSRNAMKLLMDLDQNFGLPRASNESLAAIASTTNQKVIG